jgi:hypothetical protein
MSSCPSHRRSREEAFTTPAANRNPRRRRVVTAQQPARRSSRPVVAPHPGLLLLPDNEIEIPLGAKMFRLCLRLRAFVTLQGILLLALAHAQIVHFNHHIVSLKTPKARICFHLHNNNNNNSSLIKILLLHVSVTVTNQVIPTVLNVPPTISACSTPDYIVPALVDDGFHPKCAGYKFNAGPDGGEEGAFLRSTFYYPNNMIIPISSASQGEQHPLYCIKQVLGASETSTS